MDIDDSELDEALDLVRREALDYLGRLRARPVQAPGTSSALGALDGSLPEDGAGVLGTIAEIVEDVALLVRMVRELGEKLVAAMDGQVEKALD